MDSLNRTDTDKQTPEPAHAAPRIAVVSFFVLALELALIRQLPAEVRAISYFTNLILISSFFGLGLGCILQQQRSFQWLLPLGLLLVFGFVYYGRGVVIYDEAKQVHYWLQDQDATSDAPSLGLFPSALAAFLFSALPFIALGQLLARRMDEHPRLKAYAWDIAGSLLGTATFAVCSAAQLPPWIWPPLMMVVWAFVFVQNWGSRAVHVATGLVFLLFSQSEHPAQWSPYYLVQHEQEEIGLRVWVNSCFHQFALDFGVIDSLPDYAAAVIMQRKFSIPYDRYRELHGGQSPKSVIVLGAGTGNDANVALRNGVERVVAVEIDPVIHELGKRYNTTKPYDDRRVEVHIDDARHFLHNCTEKFDLIIFATLDSQTLLSGVANLRLENYVYTVEAFKDAKKLLADGGMVGLYYSVMKPWLYGRIYSTVRQAFGDHAQLSILKNHRFLFNTVIVAAPDREDFVSDKQLINDFGYFRPNTDDWPYLYLEEPTIAPVYKKLFAAISVLIAAAFVLLRYVHPVTGLHANFFLLGMGFTLLESAAIVRLALVFGSTWVVNAVVFSAALLTILLANALVMTRAAPQLRAAWLALIATVLVNYVFPVQWLFSISTAARVVAAAVLIGAPVFFAAVCFSRLFERQRVTGYALGVNLIGAMSGALLEYSSMYIGMRNVWLILLVVYLLAWGSSWEKLRSKSTEQKKCVRPREAHTSD